MTMSEDQEILCRDLCAKLGDLHDEDGLVRFMGQVLRSLLRRKGDADFLRAVEDTLVTGLAGRAWPEQTALAQEVIFLVVAKRPEIARAWEVAQGDAGMDVAQEKGPARRATDQDVRASAAADVSADEAADLADLATYSYARAETVVADLIGESVVHRLAVFACSRPEIPAETYWHDQPVFVFDPLLPDVVRKLVRHIFVVEARPVLEREIYRFVPADVAADPAKSRSYLEGRWLKLWSLVSGVVGSLADQHHYDSDMGVGERVIEVPVTRPRIVRVLGVPLKLGSRTTMERMPVSLPHAASRTRDMKAEAISAHVHEVATWGGMDIPPVEGLEFLAALFSCDSESYSHLVTECLLLAGRGTVGSGDLLTKLRAAEIAFGPVLNDALMLLLFFRTAGEGGFSLRDLVAVHGGHVAKLAPTRPLLRVFLGRVLRDLAFQIREALKLRGQPPVLVSVARDFGEAWQLLPRPYFTAERDAALAVFAAFPAFFSGDPEEERILAIADLLRDVLASKNATASAIINALLGGVAAVPESSHG